MCTSEKKKRKKKAVRVCLQYSSPTKTPMSESWKAVNAPPYVSPLRGLCGCEQVKFLNVGKIS